jgi:hypothetical protein
MTFLVERIRMMIMTFLVERIRLISYEATFDDMATF